MEDKQTFHIKQNRITQLLLLLVLFECSALLSLLLTEDDHQLAAIKAQVTNSLGTEAPTKELERFESWRIGPYQKTKLMFARQGDQQLSVQTSHWWGFEPNIHCLSVDREKPCQ
ncbi:hypothetical protein ACFODZ_06370 [Marinicella sediminis]|uniref:Cell division protein FtsL n=1 Tax=Marinicella sediminis TaxID=1792834 RepID=A0ABV7JAW3_9GAMM|nr:hypothetical protein [Marinicella sediminis]